MAVAHRSYFQLQKNIKWKELLQKGGTVFIGLGKRQKIGSSVK